MTLQAAPVPAGPVRIHFEGMGTVTLPPVDSIAFAAGIGVLAVAGVVEWPVAGVFVITRLLAGARAGAALRGLGEALAAGMK